MAGTVDIIQRAYTGLETREGILRFNPLLPEGLKSLQFNIKYCQHWLNVTVSDELLRVTSTQKADSPIKIGFKDEVFELNSGDTLEFIWRKPGWQGSDSFPGAIRIFFKRVVYPSLYLFSLNTIV